MTQAGSVSWSLCDGIGRITLSRTEAANALSYDSGCDIAQAVDELIARDPRVVLLSAEGPIFCAGGDIDEFMSVASDLEPFIDRILDIVHPAIHRLATAPFPVVSALNGPIGGAGVGLALCADFVLASETMKLRTGYSALGLSPDLGSTYFLARRVGAARAKQWFMLSDPVDAKTCLATGVVDALYPASELGAATEALVARLAKAAPGSMASIKRLCDAMEVRELRAQLDLEHALLCERAASADGREGVRAFVEKRAPRFGGD